MLMQQTNRVKNPGKQRKRLFNAPAHIRHKLMAAPLSSELAVSKGAKTLPVKKGDTVRILRGDNKGFEGKVSRVDLKAYRIYLEGLTREKVDGTNIFLAVHPSKVQIRNLNLDDKWRKKILERKVAPEKKEKQKAKTAKITEKSPSKDTEEKVVKEVKSAAKKPIAKKGQSVVKEKKSKKESVQETAAEKAPAKPSVKSKVSKKGGN